MHDARVLGEAARGLEAVAAVAAAEGLGLAAQRVERLRVQHQQRQPRERLAAVRASVCIHHTNITSSYIKHCLT